jgi:UTP:GlnB (protein PII) uridylyltransferase
MANRNLDSEELAHANALLDDIRARLKLLAASDDSLLFAYRRKIAKELQYDERGKPMQRKMLKARKMGEQNGICPLCNKALPEKYAVLDRLNGMAGYTPENTRLIHADCDTAVQANRGYK